MLCIIFDKEFKVMQIDIKIAIDLWYAADRKTEDKVSCAL